MAWTAISKPSLGDSTKKSFADAVVDDLNYLYGYLYTAGTQRVIVNGSFENDNDADSVPDGWTWTALTGGSKTLDTAARDGFKAFKITSPGGSGNGGGSIETTDMILWDEHTLLFLTWFMKSSVSGIQSTVEVDWYDSSTPPTKISTSSPVTISTSPTSYAKYVGVFEPPANTRFCKVRLTGGSNTTAGSVWFDAVQIGEPPLNNRKQYVGSTSGNWTAVGLGYVKATVIGGGGAGGGANSDDSGGGGGGGWAISWLNVVPGSTYAYAAGAAGVAASNAVGGDGNDSTFTVGSTTLTGAHGHGGTGSAGGTGGTGTSGMWNGTGDNGAAPSGGVGGDGGSTWFGLGGRGAIASANYYRGGDGNGLGAGGGGANSQSQNAGGCGAPGGVILEYYDPNI